MGVGCALGSGFEGATTGLEGVACGADGVHNSPSGDAGCEVRVGQGGVAAGC